MSINLKPEAIKAAHNAYSPYSRLKVGAALISDAGNIYLGCNVENASFTIGACAERAAITAAVLAEGREFQLKAIAVVAFNEKGDSLPITPCGACRQAL
ncbi:MAG: cytidine deaminase, partial [Methylococcales bacterium]